MQLMPVMISLMALIVAAILALPSAGALADHREIGHLRANSGAQPESSLDSRVFRRLPGHRYRAHGGDLAMLAEMKMAPMPVPVLDDDKNERLLDETLSAAAIGAAPMSLAINAQANRRTLKYYGGPVLTRAHVFPVYMNAGISAALATNAITLDRFYAALAGSAYWNLLKQYSSISAPTIGRSTSLSNPNAAWLDSQIVAFLKAEIGQSLPQLPAGFEAQAYYPLYFAAGVTITDDTDGSTSCAQWCAYHGTFKLRGYNGTLMFGSNLFFERGAK